MYYDEFVQSMYKNTFYIMEQKIINTKVPHLKFRIVIKKELGCPKPIKILCNYLKFISQRMRECVYISFVPV